MQEIYINLMTALLGFAAILIPAFMLHKRELKKINTLLVKNQDELKKQIYAISILDRWLNIHYIEEIKAAARRIIRETQADRFLIIIGFNGKDAFKFISVIMEEHTNDADFNAIKRYKKIVIDTAYTKMLHLAEHNGPVVLNVQEMDPCVLKDFYDLEGVSHSIIRFLSRSNIDKDNDLVVFSSVATYKKKPFDRLEETLIKSAYESQIKPTLKKIMYD